jgi:hypothetical protein
MPRVDCLKTVPIVRTPRVRQLEGIFDVPPAQRSEQRWTVDLPLDARDWQIGLIVGPSGCGKSTLARELFGDVLVAGFDWPADLSIVDAFPAELGIKEITGLLSSVGFSSPPSWLRPFRCLSNGEQFRVTMARALSERRELVAIDEFTSVVDRTVARIGSAAIARAVRRGSGQPGAGRFVAVSCHYDIVDWLQPDWIFDPSSAEFQWRSLQRRPEIELKIARVHRDAWRLFGQHHYLSGTLHSAARCFVAFVEDRPAAFTAVLHHPHPNGGYWCEHRTVCLPDFQGVGIGNALSDYVASLFACTGKDYCSTTSSPAMIAHRNRSASWRMCRAPRLNRAQNNYNSLNASTAWSRFTAGFKWRGVKRREEAKAFGLVE